MRVERRSGYRLIVGGPVPPQADAITLGRTIIVRRRAANKDSLIGHELVHVGQFIDLGPVRFLARYIGPYLRFRLGGHSHMAAYRRIPLEVEASWVSRLKSVAELEPPPARSRKRRRPLSTDADVSSTAPAATAPAKARPRSLRPNRGRSARRPGRVG